MNEDQTVNVKITDNDNLNMESLNCESNGYTKQIKVELVFEEDTAYDNHLNNISCRNSDASSNTESNDINNYYCDICREKFLCKTNIVTHMRETHNNVLYGETEKCKPTFVDHVRVCKKQNGREVIMYACSVCDKQFKFPCLLTRHKKIHSSEKPHNCGICKKQFRELNKLNLHMRTHTKEKPFSCNQCDKGFSQQCSLTAHLRTHTGEKPYSCSMCYKVFSQATSLKCHMRMHTGEKPYVCNICYNRFTQLHNLKKHMKFHKETKET